MDHANNFRIIGHTGAPDSHVFVHENGFRNGRIMNRPLPFRIRMVNDAKPYFNMYRGFPFPYSLIMVPFILLNPILPALARAAFSLVGASAWPPPHNGHIAAERLQEDS